MYSRGLFLLCLLFLCASCSDEARPVNEEFGDLYGSDTRAGADTRTPPDQGEGDTAKADTRAPDVGAEPDVAGFGTRPPLSPEALRELYCQLDDDALVRAAIRGAACLDLPIASALNDAERGFWYGEILEHGYYPTTYGSCDLLVCLAEAGDCEAAQRCEEARRGEECASPGSRCVGSTLEVCSWNGESYQWLAVQDCGRMEGGECRAEPCDEPDCPQHASCQGAAQVTDCGFDYYGSCDGDVLRRCTQGEGGARLATEIAMDCGDLVEGGTCVEEAVGGEAPGPACRAMDAACNNAFAGGYSCDEATGEIEVCLYGRGVSVSCAALGYSGCEVGSFFGVRCMP